ncbi:hypothetical protein BpOF4_18340 [Alkalihalophilus pseudofirmus OF4]|uniref:DUF4363 domain-containing protein n=1 Tax=Alkalihalophilus pseudofirmus (strain ATCC BAA-2126 / JCM 17055 / OF4) TaxID=398511 RepID=D3FS74_ALKPO|nr:DUF4363 family protein [Alkalihalophilus pseudofirmus]ADC51709.1 hypothetical protein BpOF4_18340 [Alkalihalophilus pseudofirmus OF4]
MRKFLLYAIPILFMIVSFSIMISGIWLKEPLGSDDHLLSYIQNVEENVKAENWEQADQEHQKAERAWRKISKRVQYSVERDDMMAITEVLSRIEGGIKAKDEPTILPDIYYFYGIWKDLG